MIRHRAVLNFEGGSRDKYDTMEAFKRYSINPSHLDESNKMYLLCNHKFFMEKSRQSWQNSCRVRWVTAFIGVLTQIVRTLATFHVEIVTWGSTHFSTQTTLVYTSGPIDSGVQYIQGTYAGIFNVTHTYLRTSNVSACDLTQQIDFMASDWYYKRSVRADLSVFIAPGKWHSFLWN